MTTKINTHNFAEVVQYALNYRDSYTAGHQKRVAELAVLIGRRAGLDEAKIHELYIGGMLHDIGKIGIPRKILNKKDSLTEEEFMEIKNHPKIGFELIKDENFPWSVKDMVLHHHERLDGSGYPDGLRGKEISLETRIITVCDVTEAMSTERVYRAEKFADLAIPKMVEEMVSHGASVKNLAAKIAGGAAMFPLSESSKNMDIGKRNVDAVRACLNELGIPILAENVGGSLARTMIMDVKERLVIIKMPGLAEKIL